MFHQARFMSESGQMLHFLAVFKDNNGGDGRDHKPLGQLEAAFDVTFSDFNFTAYFFCDLFKDFVLFQAGEFAGITEADNTDTLRRFRVKIAVIKLNLLNAHSHLLFCNYINNDAAEEQALVTGMCVFLFLC